MEKTIDVLAVLDVACKLHKEGAYADAWEVDLARIYDVRAAVAELMEAATHAHDFAANMARNNGDELDRRFYRLRAAILNMSS